MTVRAAIAAGQEEHPELELLLMHASDLEERLLRSGQLVLPFAPVAEIAGDLFFQANRFEQARRRYGDALIARPNRARSILGIARASVRLDDREAATAAYKQFLDAWADADPDLPEIAEARAWIAKQSTVMTIMTEKPMKSRRWVSLAPQGIGHQKPFHYGEMMRVAWENRAELPFAWRILRDGVCDGCALGTSGLHDWTIPGVHLCMVRLELLRLNTAPALDLRRLDDASALTRLSSAELRELGRLPEPLIRRRGDRGFRAIAWDEALDLIAAKLRETDPQRVACYLTSRGITNEVYYVAQKAMRAIGSNHVDNSARLCHAASTAAMKTTLGHGASTCSYVDWLGADLIVFFGANTPNNQPVTTKYLHEATKRGAQIAVVNTFREPGLQRYWVPSIASSAMFGTRLADEWFDVHTGGDLAFLIGVFKALDRDDGRMAAIDARLDSLRARSHARIRRGARRGPRRRLERARGRERRVGRRHAPLRATADRAAEHDLRVVDGPHAARARRRHRPRARSTSASRADSPGGRIAG